MVVVGIDFGKEGALARFEDGALDDIKDVPTKLLITKPATYKFKHSDPKILIKSGPKAGTRQRVIKTKQKDRTLIDFDVLTEIIKDLSPDHVELEKAAVVLKSAKGTATKFENHGMLKGILMTLGIPFNEVAPIAWKKKLGVTSDKETSMRLAAQLFDGWEFKRDDQAEAALIGHWYLNCKEK